MRAVVNVFAVLCATVALGPIGPQRASANGDGAEPAEGSRAAGRWVPSLAVISGLTIQPWEAEATGIICRECPIPDPAMGETELRSASDDDLDVTPYVGANLELMTPALPVPTSPRFFVGGEAWASFGIERIVAGEGNVGILRSPLPPGNVDTGFNDAGALGQGVEVRAQLETLMYGANAGLAFPVRVMGRNLLIRPSFGWIRYEIDVEGLVVDAECRPDATGRGSECNEFLSPPGFLRAIVLETSGSETFDAIGPGLDVALDTGRIGPLGTSLFLGVRVYQVLGDRSVDLPGPMMTYDDAAGADAAEGRFSFDIDRRMYRAGLGMRFHWLGFED